MYSIAYNIARDIVHCLHYHTILYSCDDADNAAATAAAADDDDDDDGDDGDGDLQNRMLDRNTPRIIKQQGMGSYCMEFKWLGPSNSCSSCLGSKYPMALTSFR